MSRGTYCRLIVTALAITLTLGCAMEKGFDANLAKELGADEYGMRKYVLAFLRIGPNRSQNEQEAAALQRAHLDNINRLAEEGKLVLAGPFLDGGELRHLHLRC
jgi:hypothetical protein